MRQAVGSGPTVALGMPVGAHSPGSEQALGRWGGELRGSPSLSPKISDYSLDRYPQRLLGGKHQSGSGSSIHGSSLHPLRQEAGR